MESLGCVHDAKQRKRKENQITNQMPHGWLMVVPFPIHTYAEGTDQHVVNSNDGGSVCDSLVLVFSQIRK